MGVILTNTADYDMVRTKLGVDVASVPDATITATPILPLAEAWIIAAVPTYSSVTGSDSIFLKTACACLCCVQLCTALEYQLQDYATGDYRQVGSIKWAVRREQFLQEAKIALLSIAVFRVSQTRRKLFVATGPTSSNTNWSTHVEQWYAWLEPQLFKWTADGSRMLQG